MSRSTRPTARWRSAAAGVFIAATAFTTVTACGDGGAEDTVEDVEQDVEDGAEDLENEVDEEDDD